MAKEYNWKHIQHRKEYFVELNNPKNVPASPFRYSDETWIVGKFKGKKLNETPAGYISWCIKNMKLSSNALAVLKQYING